MQFICCNATFYLVLDLLFISSSMALPPPPPPTAVVEHKCWPRHHSLSYTQIYVAAPVKSTGQLAMPAF